MVFFSVPRNDITLDKTEGGLYIRNFKFSKLSLLSKNVFSHLNSSNLIWVDIVRHKYDNLNFWIGPILSTCSWFFWGLCQTIYALKHWVKSLNPDNISFMFDPWYCCDIPITFKPTYLNITLVPESIQLSDIYLGNYWDVNKSYYIFGEHLNTHFLRDCSVDVNGHNHWVWFLESKAKKVSTMVYSHLNSIAAHGQSWECWNYHWRLNIAPRVEHFTWLLLGQNQNQWVFVFP